ncbi:NAD(P)/FAD-dependent oxidoreductase [Humibacillus xanthopallidus]|uniref:NAD/ferredoxin-dependent reductase-like protein n=1 Tax=Humibacillus xanthopallidus TaxID=412689 RepID=A0A543HW24_9MICO|nr:FAD-dependent oxidoreductase [Humibacillus xanthopallidus]TQM62548.1 NAD/ferredoxin-dependent reductase-like protein [Humibacillus xanthopallidus]
MTSRPTLVVGAGQAGISLVAELRALGDKRPVVLVGDEDEPPYERPPLSKGYLRGEHNRSSLTLRDAAWCAEHGVELVTGDAVVSIERGDEGGLALTRSGRHLDFDRLALTTGASEAALPVDGAELDRVLTLRTVRDADLLAAALRDSRDVVVVGGGFIGLEVAASARLLGATVTVVEAADRLLARSVTPVLSDFYLAAHERRGTRVLLGTTAVRIHGTADRAEAVVLDDGRELRADLVVVGIGALPRTDLAAAMGLEVEPRGIVVDRRALTSDGATVAAGDCTVGPNPFTRGRPGRLRLESVAHATDQARVAAATLLGHDTAYASVPWFWSDQGDLRLQIAGLPHGADQLVIRGELGSESFSLLSYREGLLIAIEAVGASADYVVVKRALERGMTVPANLAADPSIPLRRGLQTAVTGTSDPPNNPPPSAPRS